MYYITLFFYLFDIWNLLICDGIFRFFKILWHFVSRFSSIYPITRLVCTSIMLYLIEIVHIGFRQVVRAWFRRDSDWTEQILLHDKPKFVRRIKSAGYPRTWKYKYSNRKRRGSIISFSSSESGASTDTVSSHNSFWNLLRIYIYIILTFVPDISL